MLVLHFVTETTLVALLAACATALRAAPSLLAERYPSRDDEITYAWLQLQHVRIRLALLQTWGTDARQSDLVRVARAQRHQSFERMHTLCVCNTSSVDFSTYVSFHLERPVHC